MRKIINCGKIDWNKTGRRVNLTELDLELKERDGHWCFSCCGSVWNSRRTDILVGGQCLDEMFEYPELKPYAEIYRLWKDHHLNDMHAGSPKQEEAIAKWKAGKKDRSQEYDYDAVCAMLKKKGLLEDKSYTYEGKPYRYGTAWLTRDIPEEDLKKIRKWLV